MARTFIGNQVRGEVHETVSMGDRHVGGLRRRCPGGSHNEDDYDGPPCKCEKGYYEKVVTAYKKVCREEKVPVVVKKAVYKDEMRTIKVICMVPEEYIIKRPKEIMVPVERTVTRCRKSVKLVDPETGCVVNSFKNEYYPDKVIDQEKRTIMVDAKAVRMVPQEKTTNQCVKVLTFCDETVYVSKLQCEMVPYQKTVRCPCPPLGPNYREVPVVQTPPPPPPQPPQGGGHGHHMPPLFPPGPAHATPPGAAAPPPAAPPTIAPQAVPPAAAAPVPARRSIFSFPQRNAAPPAASIQPVPNIPPPTITQ